MYMKRALITGSAGMIGRHFSPYLKDQGWEVVSCDVKTGIDVRRFFEVAHSSYDLVLHCAAHVGGRLDIENKAAFIGAYNVQLDGAVFEWALRTRPAHLVYWSSSAAYPTLLQTGYVPTLLREEDIDISHPSVADQTYGWAKLVGERMAYECQQEGLKVHVFRPFSGYASDQCTDYPFGAYLERARNRQDPFTIWGDGDQVRDFIHIDDIISATMAAIDNDYPGPLNLCTGIPTSFNTLASMVTNAAGYSPAVEHDRTKPEGVRYRVGDPTEMHKVWVPKVSLEEGIKRVLG
jgi:nucleoside-diphosphate-sugar epimerase